MTKMIKVASVCLASTALVVGASACGSVSLSTLASARSPTLRQRWRPFASLGRPNDRRAPRHPYQRFNFNSRSPAAWSVAGFLAKLSRIYRFSPVAKKLEPGTGATPISFAIQWENSTSLA